MSNNIHRHFLSFCDSIYPLIEEEKKEEFKLKIIKHQKHFQKKEKNVAKSEVDKRREIFNQIRSSLDSIEEIRHFQVDQSSMLTINLCVETLSKLIQFEKNVKNKGMQCAITQVKVLAKLRQLEATSMVSFVKKT